MRQMQYHQRIDGNKFSGGKQGQSRDSFVTAPSAKQNTVQREQRDDALEDLEDLTGYLPTSTCNIRCGDVDWQRDLESYPPMNDVKHVPAKCLEAHGYLRQRLGYAKHIRRANASH